MHCEPHVAIPRSLRARCVSFDEPSAYPGIFEDNLIVLYPHDAMTSRALSDRGTATGGSQCTAKPPLSLCLRRGGRKI